MTFGVRSQLSPATEQRVLSLPYVDYGRHIFKQRFSYRFWVAARTLKHADYQKPARQLEMPQNDAAAPDAFSSRARLAVHGLSKPLR